MNPPFFFCVFLSPFVCSYDFIKGSRIGFAKFFRRNTTPLRVWRFPRNPLGSETLPFQFAFYLCRRNNQTSGDRKTKAVRSGDGFVHAGYSRSLLFAEANQTNGMMEAVRWQRTNGLAVGIGTRKSNQNRADDKRESAVPTCNTESLYGFQFANGYSRFHRPLTVGRVL